jgi:hypothetical protein
MPVGLGAAGWLAIAYESTMGTYVPPTTAGTIWAPILSETLAYTEEAYYSEQIRNEVTDSSREQGYYHIEGDVVMEFDANVVPMFLYCARHTIAETPGTPNLYVYTPSKVAQATTDKADATKPKTASITVVRNGVGFGYAGCVVNSMEFTIETGVLRCTFGILGLSEEEPNALHEPVWVDPSLMGASAHSIYVDDAGLDPTFAAASEGFNGFTATINNNGAAQNRIVRDRAATYISYAKSEATYSTELDFETRDDYDDYVENTRRAIRLESIKGENTTNWSDADEGFRITFYNTAYDTYPINLSGMSDLIMASVTGRALAIVGGSPYKIEVKTSLDAATPTT